MSDTYTTPILLRGDMIASMTGSPTSQGNPGDADYGMVMNDVQALGSTTDLYRLVWYQNVNGTANEFADGQGWRLEVYDPFQDTGDNDPTVGNDGWTTVSGMSLLTPKDTLVNGLGAGDEYIVFDTGSGSLLYNMNGGLPTSPTQLTYLASDEQGAAGVGDNDGQMDFVDSYNAIVCFAAGTTIATPTGPRPVESLRPGDLVCTRDRGPQPVAWASARHVSSQELARREHLRPVRIKAGALGRGLPERDLMVSPQHRILTHSRIAERMVGKADVLVPAIRLTHLPGITQVRAERGVSYHHFMLDRHEVVLANGAETESFYPGQEALKTIGAAARDELFALFPSLSVPLPGMKVRSAFPIVAGRIARTLVDRHKKNGQALLAAA